MGSIVLATGSRASRELPDLIRRARRPRGGAGTFGPHSVLTEAERVAGDTMVPRVSRCRSPRLVLDR
ncbi:hypothetical protein [Microbispora sp. NPDC046933]|uniref:hypothetical protein n=1 Tax=Microbispora sp. NPDC046933 TaxID=3155618 RepID=UPI0033F77932